MVRRGLSAEEKRQKILAIYHSSKSIFNLKEIEKAASKQGVVSQSVKVRIKFLYNMLFLSLWILFCCTSSFLC